MATRVPHDHGLDVVPTTHEPTTGRRTNPTVRRDATGPFDAWHVLPWEVGRSTDGNLPSGPSVQISEAFGPPRGLPDGTTRADEEQP